MSLSRGPILIFAVFILLLVGCKKEDIPPAQTQLDRINNWIYEEMDYWYLWTTDLPDKPQTNINPRSFYYSLLAPQDQFSFIYEDYQDLIDLLNGVTLESGFEFKLYLDAETSDGVIILLTYIKEGSPADALGLKRGDVIHSINGNKITESNYRNLLDELNFPYEASYRRYNFETESFEDQGSFNIDPISFAENPILLDTLYEISGRKIGYLIYTFFSTGPSGGSYIYDEQMDDVFSRFKSQGITDLVLDLRFNSGGSEVSARNLASLIVKNATPDDVMFKKAYNDQVQDLILNDERYGANYLNVTFSEKPENVGSSTGNTVYIITSNRSASASELVINSLRPYMETYIIGDTTRGKDVGSISIYDEEDPLNNWAIQPIIVKVINAVDQDYPQGFYPNVPIKDNFLILKPLGDNDEPLLNAALSAIGVQNARQIPASEQLISYPLFESLDQNRGKGRLIMENPGVEFNP